MDTDSMMLKMVPMRPTTWFVLMRQYTHGLVLSLSLALSLSLSLTPPGRIRPTAWKQTYRGNNHSFERQKKKKKKKQKKKKKKKKKTKKKNKKQRSVPVRGYPRTRAHGSG